MMAVLDAVATAPPPQFSGEGFWEAMHGKMAGYMIRDPDNIQIELAAPIGYASIFAAGGRNRAINR